MFTCHKSIPIYSFSIGSLATNVVIRQFRHFFFFVFRILNVRDVETKRNMAHAEWSEK